MEMTTALPGFEVCAVVLGVVGAILSLVGAVLVLLLQQEEMSQEEPGKTKSGQGGTGIISPHLAIAQASGAARANRARSRSGESSKSRVSLEPVRGSATSGRKPRRHNSDPIPSEEAVDVMRKRLGKASNEQQRRTTVGEVHMLQPPPSRADGSRKRIAEQRSSRARHARAEELQDMARLAAMGDEMQEASRLAARYVREAELQEMDRLAAMAEMDDVERCDVSASFHELINSQSFSELANETCEQLRMS